LFGVRKCTTPPDLETTPLFLAIVVVQKRPKEKRVQIVPNSVTKL
jgi:hypothetical protein